MVVYVEENDEDDEKFDLILFEDFFVYFKIFYDFFVFDFSFVDVNLKLIREFVKKWGFFKMVFIFDILYRV